MKLTKITLIFLLLISTSYGLEKVSIQLKWLHQFQFAGYYTAKEKGFYEEVGLDVDIRERIISQDPIQPVLDGDVEYGIADSILMLYKAKKEPVVIVAPIFQHSPSVLLTLKESGLDSPYKLDGKNAIFYQHDTDGFSILAMLKKLDIKPKFIRKREKGDYKKVISGEADVIPGYLTNEPFYFKQEGKEVNIINPTNYGFDLYGDMLFTNENEASNHPERVAKFREATLRGWDYALKNKEEIIQLIHKKYNNKKSIEHLRFEADAIEQVVSQRTIPLGTLEEGRISFIIDLYKQYGLLEGSINLSEFIFKNYIYNLSLTDEERRYLLGKKKITMCIDPNWMPFEKNENGKHIGMSAEYFDIFAKEIGIPIEYIPTKTWTESLNLGKSRECDIFSLVMETQKRKSYLDFSKPYIEVPLVIVTNIDEVFISEIQSVIKEKIGVVKGYAYKEILQNKYPEINLIDVENIDVGLEKVANGDLFGFVGALSTTAYKIQTNYPGELKVTGKFDEKWSLGVGSRNDEPHLKNIFNKAIDNIPERKHQEIINRWISVKLESKTDYKELLQWIGGVVLVFGTILFIVARSNRRLNTEIQSRKKIEKRLKSFIQLVDENVITSTTDLKGEIVYASEAFCKISKYNKEELLGKQHNILRDPTMPSDLYKTLWETIQNNETWSGEIKNRAKDGSAYWVRSTISPVFEEGEKIGYTSIREDITDKKIIEEISITDGLTNIYNRRHFNDLFPKIINSAKRDNEYVSFLLLDIDHFKQYNDTYGHQEGDEVLKAVSKALKGSLHRATDLCFRLGGEEFGVVFTGLDKEKSESFANKIKENIENLKIDHAHNSASQYVTASFGLYVERGETSKDGDTIYKQADDLLYTAKETGRNKVVMN